MGNQEYGPQPSGEPVWQAPPPQPQSDPVAYPLTSPVAYPPAHPQPYLPPYLPPYPPPYPPQFGAAGTDKNWMGVASLVLSVVGMWLLGLIFGILGINAANKGRANNRAMSIWGVSVSVAWVMGTVVAVVVVGFAVGAIGENHVPYSGLAVGDCIQEPAGWVDGGSDLRTPDVTRVSCAKQHWGQVYYLDVLGGTDYPGDDAVQASAEDMCFSDAAAANVDPAHLDQVAVFYIMPTAESWVHGNRYVICLASDAQHTLTESWVAVPTPTQA